MKTLVLLIAAACAALVPPDARAEEAPPDRALILSLKWEASGVSIEKIDKKEMAVPVQLGFPQLWKRFYELRDKDGDVHFAGALMDSRTPRGAEGTESGVMTFRVVLPDLEEARHLVIIQRVSTHPDTGRKVMLEQDL